MERAARLAPPPTFTAVALALMAGITLDSWQAAVLQSQASRLLMNAARQTGKSTVTAVLAVWTALTQPGALVLLLSPSLRQSQELFRRCLHVYGAAGQPVPSYAESALRLELVNGARLVALPGKEATVRGYSNVTLLAIDEASRVGDELYASVRPMLAVSGGRLVGLSTPWGRRGWWFEAWHSAEPWERFLVRATDCARIPASFLEEERRTLPPLLFRSEYCCEFTDTIDQLFSSDVIEAALSDDIPPLFALPPAAGPVAFLTDLGPVG